ncbi:him1p [Saccharomyces arboricola H-6]|uniref:Him1p n=1 Tax=Saccharomyces arboricola (strain H-6 / AS 2.3317 / CBS 10644) TaxID=1160507 RepID=J8Q3W2_SACAR|nr:him1p [Saccharomyces arboricola H-6]
MNDSIKTFTDYILFFGSSGLTGKGTLENLLDINFYVKNVSDLQDKLDSLKEIKCDIVLNKHVFCINRRSFTEKKSFVKEIDYVNMKSIIRKGGRYYLRSRKGNETKRETSNSNTFCYDNFEEGFIRSANDERLKDNYSFAYNQKQFSYALHYACGKEDDFEIKYNFTVTQLIIPRSESWARLLPRIFSGTQKLERFDVDNKNYVPDKSLPSLSDIGTMVCTLGSTSTRVRRTQVPEIFVDYYLPFNLAQEFTNTADKKLVLITSFNNDILSRSFQYFRTKAKLESDLEEVLPNKLKELIILRPGPMCGQHGDPVNVKLEVEENPSFTERILYYPRYFFKYKQQYISEARKIGLRTKLSELIASCIYRMPGSALLGYSVPVSKVSYVSSLMAIGKKSKEAGPKVEVISSYQIDMIA